MARGGKKEGKGIFDLFLSPREFFGREIGKGIRKTLLIFLGVSIAMVVIEGAVLYFTEGYYFVNEVSFSGLGINMVYLLLVGIVVMSVLMFVYSTIVYSSLRIFRIKDARWKEVFNICTYSFIPYMILSIIPRYGGFSYFYSLFLIVFGLSSVYGTSKTRSVIAGLMPIILLFVLVGIYVLVFGNELSV